MLYEAALPVCTMMTSAGNRQDNVSLQIQTQTQIQQQQPIRPGTLMVYVIKVSCEVELREPYVRIKSPGSNQLFKTSTAESTNAGVWNEGFELRLSVHDVLFGSVQLDLFSSSVFWRDSHIGRSSVRIIDLLVCGNDFTSWYELNAKRTDLLAVHDAYLHNITSHPRLGGGGSAGAIQVRFKFEPDVPASESIASPMRMTPKSILKGSSSGDISTDDIANVQAQKQSGEIQEQESFIEGEALERGLSDEFIEEEEKLFFDETTDKDMIGKMIDNVFFVSKETKTTLHLIRRIFKAFGFGIKSNAQLLARLLAIETFYRIAVPISCPTNEPLYDLAFIEKTRHLYRYSMAAYGWRGLTFFGKMNPRIKDLATAKADIACLLEYLKISPSSLLLHSFDQSKTHFHERNYFVAVDTSMDALILSIRGTMSSTDTLVDLACEYVDWNGGFIHKGFLASAKWFLRNVVPQIMDILQERKELNKLIVVGHSLGSAVGSTLTLLMDQKRKELGLDQLGVELECWCFAPPCTVSLNIAERESTKRLIKSFVYGEDVVCRLSYGSILDFKTLLLASIEILGNSTLDGLTGVFTGVSKERQDVLVSALGRMRSDLSKKQRNPKLAIPGLVYHLYDASAYYDVPAVGMGGDTPSTEMTRTQEGGQQAMSDANMCNDSTRENKNNSSTSPTSPTSPSSSTTTLHHHHSTIRLVESSANNFSEIQLRRSMLLDHLPSTYDLALDRCFQETMKIVATRDAKVELSDSEVERVVQDVGDAMNQSTRSPDHACELIVDSIQETCDENKQEDSTEDVPLRTETRPPTDTPSIK